MENIVYKRDYKEAKAARDKQHRNDIPSQVFDYLITSDALATMNDAYTEMPRVINDGHKAAYERILNALDRIANTFGGENRRCCGLSELGSKYFCCTPLCRVFVCR